MKRNAASFGGGRDGIADPIREWVEALASGAPFNHPIPSGCPADLHYYSLNDQAAIVLAAADAR